MSDILDIVNRLLSLACAPDWLLVEQVRFFTPEPPASPGPETASGQDEEDEGTLRGCERLQSSTLQAVNA